MKSSLNLTIDIEGAALPVGTTAEGIAQAITKYLATEYGPAGLPVVQFGRYSRQGSEAGPNVTVRLDSAALHVKSSAIYEEASTLGWAPGHWPASTYFAGRVFARAEARGDGSYRYTNDEGQDLIVLND